MTDQQIDALEAGQELNELIDKHVFGQDSKINCENFKAGRCDGQKITRCGACGGTGHANCYGKGLGGELQMECETGCHGRPDYSSDIAAAWLVVEKMQQQKFWFNCCYESGALKDSSAMAWFCRFRAFKRAEAVDGFAGDFNFALGVCKAALKVVNR